MATKAITIKEAHGVEYDAIATATPTAKYLVERAVSKLEHSAGYLPIHVLDRSPYPELGGVFESFKGQNVLILADIIASGGLAKRLASTVDRLGARPVGILSLLITGEEVIAKREVRYSVNRKPIPVFSLADLLIPAVAAGSNDELIPIDPFKVFPSDKPQRIVDPIYSHKEFIEHMESAKAIGFGFFRADWHRMLTAIKPKAFFAEREPGLVPVEELMAPMLEKLQDADLVVTAHGRAEAILRDYLEQSIPRSLPWITMPRKGSPEGPETFFLLPKHQKVLAGMKEKHAAVVFLSIETAERLRDIVSILAFSGLHKVTVLTVLNRMPTPTAGFTYHLASLFTGRSVEPNTEFSFKALYSLQEFDSRILMELEETLERVEDTYVELTRNPSFELWLQHDIKYFYPMHLSSRAFIDTQPMLANDLDLLDSKASFNPRTIEGQFAYIAQEIASKREYCHLVKAIHVIGRTDLYPSYLKRWLYTVIGLAIIDIGYVRQIEVYDEIRAELVARIRDLRRRRTANGDFQSPSIIASAMWTVERETDFIFALSLLAYFDAGHDYSIYLCEFLEDEIRSETDPPALTDSEWIYYSEERVAWCLSILTLLGCPNFRSEPRLVDLPGGETTRAQAINRLEKLIASLGNSEPTKELAEAIARNIHEDGEDGGRDAKLTVVRTVKDNLNMLLNDLAVDRPRERHAVIRFLFRHLLDPKRNHNPIWKNLGTAVQIVRLQLSEAEGTTLRITDDGHKKMLETGFHSAGIAKQVAGAVRSFYQFTAPESAGSQFYTATVDEEGLLMCADRLAKSITSLRRKHTCTRALAREIIRDWGKLRAYLFLSSPPAPQTAPDETTASGQPAGHQSPMSQDGTEESSSDAERGEESATHVVHLLREQLTPVRALVQEAFARIREDGVRVRECWRPTMEALIEDPTSLLDPGSRAIASPELGHALGEKSLLVEVLHNLLSNVRYAARSPLEILGSEAVRFRIVCSWRLLDGESKEYWSLEVRSRNSPGREKVQLPASGSSATVLKQKRDIAKFGGSLDIRSDGDVTIASLHLLARLQTGGAPTEWIPRALGSETFP